MGLFRRRSPATEGPRERRRGDREALDEWVRTRVGVEVYVEPKTNITGVSMMLVAADGEFTRKLIDSPKVAQNFARDHHIPVYDAMIVGYPQRMRDYSRRQRILAERAQRDALGD